MEIVSKDGNSLFFQECHYTDQIFFGTNFFYECPPHQTITSFAFQNALEMGGILIPMYHVLEVDTFFGVLRMKNNGTENSISSIIIRENVIVKKPPERFLPRWIKQWARDKHSVVFTTGYIGSNPILEVDFKWFPGILLWRRIWIIVSGTILGQMSNKDYSSRKIAGASI